MYVICVDTPVAVTANPESAKQWAEHYYGTGTVYVTGYEQLYPIAVMRRPLGRKPKWAVHKDCPDSFDPFLKLI